MSVTREQLMRFRELLASSLGLAFDEHRWQQLGEVLERRVSACSGSIELYFGLLANPHAAEAEQRVLISELTVGETYFFRNGEQLRALMEVVLPERARVGQPLRVLCLGCASGEEAYTLAISLREQLAAHDFELIAVDGNPAALQSARCARYSARALRETPPSVQRRWFTRDGADHVLDPDIVAQVSFLERNLAHAQPDLFPKDHFDVVFFRNVLMYFTPAAARAVIERVTPALAPGGYLFLGHAETLRGLSTAFDLRQSHDTFYYQRRRAGDAAAIAPSKHPSSRAHPMQRSSEHTVALAEPSTVACASAAPRLRARLDLQVPLALLQEERFVEALQAMEAVEDVDAHCEGLLLRAVLLTHTGQLEAAAVATGKLLQRDELHAGAHYLRALCCESSGDHEGAIRHDQTAIHLDPGFAMPHLHLGLLARRSDDQDGARRELSQALLLLELEDPARLLFFGGGFGREMLITLCRAELVASGAAA